MELVNDLQLQELCLALETTMSLGKPCYYVKSCTSTNDIVNKLGEAGAPEGLVVVAESMTHGRGRRGHSWFNNADSLQFSMLLRPPSELEDLPFLNVLVAYAVLKVLYGLYRLPLLLKWPNDLLIGQRKLCGVMSEMRTSGDNSNFVVMGCGLNLNNRADAFPAELKSVATSVFAETGQSTDKEHLLTKLFPIISTLYTGYLKQEPA